MGELSGFSGRQVISKLEKLGFIFVSQRGSHKKLRKIVDGKIITAIVPEHAELAVGTLRNVLRQAQVSVQEFLMI